METNYIIIYFIVINVVTFLAYGYDKFCAQRGYWRVPEKTLFVLIALGGSPFAFIASRIFRHKNRKATFRFNFWVIAILQVIALAVAWNYGYISIGDSQQNMYQYEDAYEYY